MNTKLPAALVPGIDSLVVAVVEHGSTVERPVPVARVEETTTTVSVNEMWCDIPMVLVRTADMRPGDQSLVMDPRVPVVVL